ncbi:hypothetical protein [Deinococcus pimensis]|uniref:hypothetical protein n=1 Tax=Deinococcus pimensis TaxID=309888 RepID=UPI0004B8BB14|nr:hypothetical protein [Deinococcus pimensis]
MRSCAPVPAARDTITTRAARADQPVVFRILVVLHVGIAVALTGRFFMEVIPEFRDSGR